MASVTAMANCIGLDTSGSVSILGDLFGFFRARVPADPCGSGPTRVSLLELVRSLQGSHFHLNVIRVGIDTFSDDQIDFIDAAVLRAREIYAAVDLGIGRIEHWDITAADADGKDNLDSEEAALELTSDWSVANDGLDVFIPLTFIYLGWSAIGGSCNKSKTTALTGSILHVSRTADGLARTFSHEVGHYLGLPHPPEGEEGPLDLMTQTGDVSDICAAVELNTSQGATVRSHCFVKSGC
jgi:hypothetical protein